MIQVLVMGGTSFFGKRLVTNLLQEGCDVTLATRRITPDPFADRVKRVKFERTDRQSMEQAFGNSRFDVVFDQLGFAPGDVADACQVFAGKVGRYILTSSTLVYPPGIDLVEEDFDPYVIEPGEERCPPLSYEEGKKRAEAYLFQKAPFPVAAVRPPFVLGPDDPSGRLQFVVRRVMKERPIVVKQPQGRWNHAEVGDVARFLMWLGLSERTGAYNIASTYTLNVGELIQRVGDILGMKPVILDKGTVEDMSFYSHPYSKTVSVVKAQREGYQVSDFEAWFPRVVRETAALLAPTLAPGLITREQPVLA